MTTSLRIPLHSFIDLITNSSSETFVAADRQTVSALEGIIDVLLSSVGSDQKCHDLFRIGLDTEDGGYGHYKILYVEARDPKCRLAAKALDQLREAFVPVYQENSDRSGERYIIRANENAPRIIEDAINGVLGAVGSSKTACDIVTISTKVAKPKASECDDDELKLVIEPTETGENYQRVSEAINRIGKIFTAETVGND